MRERPASDGDTDPRLLLLAPRDDVFVLRAALAAGETLAIAGHAITVAEPLGLGHKLARRAIAPGEKVIKYGVPIGSATRAIALGEHVHLHNLQSDYTATHALAETAAGDGR